MSRRKKVRTQEPEEKKTFRFVRETKDGEKEVLELESNARDVITKGTLTRPNSDYEYVGEFKNLKPHGRGKLNDRDLIYEGEFKRGKLNGQGIMRDRNGDTYVGEFKNNIFHGEGEYKYDDKVFKGSFYEGNMVEGTEESPLGVYKGEFRGMGIREGRGQMRYKNGDVYDGNWYFEGRHGSGLFYDKGKNRTIRGVWHYNRPHGDFVDVKTGEKYSYYLGEEKKFRELNDAKRCPNESAISLTAYDDDDANAEYPDDLIYLLRGDVYYCVLRSELKDVMDKQERVYAWIPRPSYPGGCCAYEFLPRFKILGFGWFDAQTYTNLMNPEFNKFRIVDLGEQRIGSRFGMSSLSNVKELIRQAVPVRNVNDRAVPIPEKPVYFQSEEYNNPFFAGRAGDYQDKYSEEHNFNEAIYYDYPVPIEEDPQETMAQFRQQYVMQ